MMENLSITKNSKREVTITVPLEKNSQNCVLSKADYDNYLRRLTQILAYSAVSYDLTLSLYKVKLQNTIVFNFKGEEENIRHLIKRFE